MLSFKTYIFLLSQMLNKINLYFLNLLYDTVHRLQREVGELGDSRNMKESCLSRSELMECRKCVSYINKIIIYNTSLQFTSKAVICSKFLG